MHNPQHSPGHLQGIGGSPREPRAGSHRAKGHPHRSGLAHAIRVLAENISELPATLALSGAEYVA